MCARDDNRIVQTDLAIRRNGMIVSNVISGKPREGELQAAYCSVLYCAVNCWFVFYQENDLTSVSVKILRGIADLDHNCSS